MTDKLKAEKPANIGWERFRQAVHAIAKAGPQHKIEIGGAKAKGEPKPAVKVVRRPNRRDSWSTLNHSFSRSAS